MIRKTFFAFAALVTLVSPTVGAEPLKAGVATADITPPIPYRMAGYFNERLSTGKKDPLMAKALVLEQGDVRAALVFCDLVGISPEVATSARQQASRETGIPADHIAVAATHSHTGPLYFDALRNHFHERSIERFGKDPYETLDYPAELTKSIIAAIADAKAALAPVDLRAGYAKETRLSFNRRFHMKDGSVRFNPGQLNPDIIRPAGPIDPQVGIVSLQRPGAEKPFAGMYAFALHCDTVSGTEYSADYPKHVEDRLRQDFGPEFLALFGAGTCGDINHIDVSTRGVRTAPEIGGLLGETVSAALQSDELALIAEPSLAVRSATVNVPLQSYLADEVADAQKKMDLIGTRELSFLDSVKAYKITALQNYESSSVSLEVQVIRLSKDAAIVTLPAEVFVELGLAIKAASPFKTTIIVELSNNCLGYLPTKKAFAEGSYETVNSRIQPGGGEMVAQAAIKLLEESR